MSTDQQTAVLEHLQHIRGTVDSIDGRLDGFEGRIVSIEQDFLALAKNEAGRLLDAQALERRLERLEQRVAQLERHRPPPSASP